MVHDLETSGRVSERTIDDILKSETHPVEPTGVAKKFIDSIHDYVDKAPKETVEDMQAITEHLKDVETEFGEMFEHLQNKASKLA